MVVLKGIALLYIIQGKPIVVSTREIKGVLTIDRMQLNLQCGYRKEYIRWASIEVV